MNHQFSGGLLSKPTVDGFPASSMMLFQNIIQALLLQAVDPCAADRVQPKRLRTWFERLAIPSGIPAAAGISTPNPAAHAPPPTMRFDPTPAGLEQLILAHLALRRCIAAGLADEGARDTLAVLAAVATALREEGLRPALTSAARRVWAALGRGDLRLPDLEGI